VLLFVFCFLVDFLSLFFFFFKQKAAQEEKRKAWLKDYSNLQKTPPGETTEARQARMKKTAELIARFKEANAEANAAANAEPQYHGYVWLYLRQDRVARAE